MRYLNLCQDLKGTGQTQEWVRDDSFLHSSEISPLLSPNSSTVPSSTSPLHGTSIIMCCFMQYPGYCCLSSHPRESNFPVLFSFVDPWTAHFYRNDLLVVINESCVLSVLRQVLMFSEFWYIPARLCLWVLIQRLWIHTRILRRCWIDHSQVSKHLEEQYQKVAVLRKRRAHVQGSSGPCRTFCIWLHHLGLYESNDVYSLF